MRVGFGRLCRCRCRPRLPRRHFWSILQVPVSVETSAPSLLAIFAGAGVCRDFCAVTFGRFCGCRCRPRLLHRHFRAKMQVPVLRLTSALSFSAKSAGAGGRLWRLQREKCIKNRRVAVGGKVFGEKCLSLRTRFPYPCNDRCTRS